MRLRDSGMPDEEYWESLFDVKLVLDRLGIHPGLRDVAEFGCGYGTFTIPIARTISGVVYTFDIDPAMVSRTTTRAQSAGIANVVCREHDVMEHGFGLTNVDAVLLFNILHCENPHRLLRHAANAVRAGGQILVIHWRFDATTPRGPGLDIRPKPENIMQWAQQIGGLALQGTTIDLPPWHYGLRFVRSQDTAP